MKATIPFTVALDEVDRHEAWVVWSVTVLENPEVRTRLCVDVDEDLARVLRDDIIGDEIALMIAKTA